MNKKSIFIIVTCYLIQPAFACKNMNNNNSNVIFKTPSGSQIRATIHPDDVGKFKSMKKNDAVKIIPVNELILNDGKQDQSVQLNDGKQDEVMHED